MFCKYCGISIPNDTVFCPSCGKQVSSSAEAESKQLVTREEPQPTGETTSPQEGGDSHSRGYAITSLACGIGSLACIWYSYSTVVGIAAGIVGLIFGIKANKLQKQGMATAGVITSIVGLTLSAISFSACTLCAALCGASLI